MLSRLTTTVLGLARKGRVRGKRGARWQPALAPEAEAALPGARRCIRFPLPLVGTLALLFLLAGCGGDPGTGPVQVKWDRAACERCRMVLSDRHHAAQVRIRDPQGRSPVYLFDDIGCAVVWLEDKPFQDDPATEIWVTDWRTGDWIDARTATYLPDQVTPMEYGLGAQTTGARGGLSFEQARAHIAEIEQRFNVHGSHLDHGALGRKP